MHRTGRGSGRTQTPRPCANRGTCSLLWIICVEPCQLPDLHALAVRVGNAQNRSRFWATPLAKTRVYMKQETRRARSSSLQRRTLNPKRSWSGWEIRGNASEGTSPFLLRRAATERQHLITPLNPKPESLNPNWAEKKPNLCTVS